MSRTRKSDRLIRPCKRYIKYQAGRDPEDPGENEGEFTYYDKEKEKDIVEDMTRPFIVLDGSEFGSNLMTVTGWSEAHRAYCWSNEVRSVEDELVVRAFDKKKSIVAQGCYSEIKHELKELGLKFTRCIYFVFAGEEELNHLQLHGGAFRQWAEAIESESHKLQDYTCKFVESTKEKKGKVSYYSPHFDWGPEIDEDEGILADKADEKLQDYLDKYLKKDPNQTPEYNKEDQDTDSWASVELDDGQELGDLDLDKLNEIREHLEEEGEEDSTLYQFVCRACKEKSKEEKEEPKKEEPKKKKPLSDLLRKKKKEDDNSWRKVKLPEGADYDLMGDATYEYICEFKEMMENENLQEEWSELYEACVAGAKNPF